MQWGKLPNQIIGRHLFEASTVDSGIESTMLPMWMILQCGTTIPRSCKSRVIRDGNMTFPRCSFGYHKTNGGCGLPNQPSIDSGHSRSGEERPTRQGFYVAEWLHSLMVDWPRQLHGHIIDKEVDFLRRSGPAKEEIVQVYKCVRCARHFNGADDPRLRAIKCTQLIRW